MTIIFHLCGILRGHNGDVTKICTFPNNPNQLLSASRDRSAIIWKLTPDKGKRSLEKYGTPFKTLNGHTDYVSDACISAQGNYALSASWDKTMRLWDINIGTTVREFVGHTREIASAAISPDNRRIISGSRDKSIRDWSISGKCARTIRRNQGGHTGWVSSVRFLPGDYNPQYALSCGIDSRVKVWDLNNFRLNIDHYVSDVDGLKVAEFSPDHTLYAAGGRDGVVIFWDRFKRLAVGNVVHDNPINSIAFSPVRFWMAIAHGPTITIWDIEGQVAIKDLNVGRQFRGAQLYCLSLAWSDDGQKLYSGYSDNLIRVWQVLETDIPNQNEEQVKPNKVNLFSKKY